jgi:TraM recognition site of TraD and TraG
MPPYCDDLDMAAEYTLVEYPSLGDRTGPNIVTTAMNLVEKLIGGEAGKLIASGETNLSPDDVLDGRIVVVDTPLLRDYEYGRFVQLGWKLATIRAVLRRPEHVRPVVIWADEAQLHAVPSVDSQTQAVARSHKLINVAITQNINLLESVFRSKEDARAWISNLMTRFIFANTCRETNEYFSAMCGQSKQLLMGGSSHSKPYDLVGDMLGEEQCGSASFNESWQPQVRPECFVGGLRKGGRENAYWVDFFVVQGGRKFDGNRGRTWLLTSFRQRV